MKTYISLLSFGASGTLFPGNTVFTIGSITYDKGSRKGTPFIDPVTGKEIGFYLCENNMSNYLISMKYIKEINLEEEEIIL